MAREKRKQEEKEADEVEKTIDPYTGELVPVPEDADQFIEVMPEETDDRRGSNYILTEETSMDSYVADADSDAAAEQAAHYTEDPDIQADFSERQGLATGGRDALLEKLEEHNSLSPRISGGDIDAAWQDANGAGEEAVGGSVSTPDQDVVDELGEAAGLQYEDDEPLDYDRKVLERDRTRWELDPASALTQGDELENEQDDDEDDELDEDELDEGEEFDEDDLDELMELDGDEEDEDEDDLKEDIEALDPELEDDEDDVLDAEFDDSEDDDE
ncbi:MAG TPA: DUF6335 family protein [Anaerolineales bacterium]|nr:DUF6335 family protein [Anaerolineales bacterium]